MVAHTPLKRARLPVPPQSHIGRPAASAELTLLLYTTFSFCQEITRTFFAPAFVCMQKTQRRRKTPQFCTNTVANQRADQTTLCNKEAKRFKTCYGEQRRRRRMGKVVVSAPPKCAPRREACEGTEPVRRAEALAVSAAAASPPAIVPGR